MNFRTRPYLLKAFKLYDMAVMTCAFAMTAVINQYYEYTGSLNEFITLRLEIHNFAVFLFWLILWNEILAYFNLYESKRLSSSWIRESLDVIKAVSLGTIVIWITSIALNIEIITPTFIAIFWSLTYSITIVSRIVLRYLLIQVRFWGRNLNHVLIVGTNARAIKLARKIESDRGLGYILVGFADDQWKGNHDIADYRHAVVTDLNGFQDYLRDHTVDEVIICIPIKSFYDRVSSILNQCETQGITVRFISDIFTPTKGRTQIDQFAETNVVTVATGNITAEGMVLKHLLDFLLSFILFAVLAPVFLIIALLIKFDSPGPVFFLQERIGLNKRRFRLYKFRTMVVGAEKKQAALQHLNEMQGPVFKIKHDPRVTRFGRFLRKTSIDELPQLINVLKGDMSLVGPRPLPVDDYEGFDQDAHRRRLSVRPGITCLWQVEGRNSIPFDKWMELDLQYIDHWSLWLDLKILLKTIPAVVKGTGAS